MSIVSLRLGDVTDRLKDRRITLNVDEVARDWLAKEGYSAVYGARAIARIVRSKVLFPLAKKLLEGTVRYVDFAPFGYAYSISVALRNGDVVFIRVKEDGSDLVILDNHAADENAEGAVGLQTVVGEEHEEEDHY